MKGNKFLISCYLLLIISIGHARSQNLYPKYEFRAVWVATVNNIDWPSKPGLNVEQMKEEALQILDKQSALGMNAIILQVRPASDAFYKSDIEPWSKYLTGIPGKAPGDGFDPLSFWVEECHNRGMELHAWLSPFRLSQNYLDPIAGNHIAFTHPGWVVKYGNTLYFDPGIPEVWNYISQVVEDIVKRYDIDAIHFDDYFYPYPLSENFSDSKSFALYNRGFGPGEIADWRRSNVDSVICRLHKTIKSTKSWVKFGISPFGVWRNKREDPDGSNTTGGTSNYNNLYANILIWLKYGWVDYVVPQIYWQVGHPSVDFSTLAEWWGKHSFGKQVYIGQAAFKSDINSNIKEWALPNELPKQIRIIRNTEGLNGSVFFSSKHFNRDLMGFQDSLVSIYYKRPAIIPPLKPETNIAPPKPVTNISKLGKMVRWKTEKSRGDHSSARYFVIYLNELGTLFNASDARFILSVQKENECTFKSINKTKKQYEFRVSALDRWNNESEISKPIILKL